MNCITCGKRILNVVEPLRKFLVRPIRQISLSSSTGAWYWIQLSEDVQVFEPGSNGHWEIPKEQFQSYFVWKGTSNWIIMARSRVGRIGTEVVGWSTPSSHWHVLEWRVVSVWDEPTVVTRETRNAMILTRKRIALILWARHRRMCAWVSFGSPHLGHLLDALGVQFSFIDDQYSTTHRHFCDNNFFWNCRALY